MYVLKEFILLYSMAYKLLFVAAAASYILFYLLKTFIKKSCLC